MTNEQAIKILKAVQSAHDYKPDVDAFDMAIKSLQRGLENVNADSCSEKPNESDLVKESGDLVKDLVNDCISRQALYEILDEYDEGKIYWGEAEDRIGNLPSAQPERKFDAMSVYEQAYKNGLRDAQPELNWILASERLPDENHKVLVCLTDWQTGEQEIDVSYRRDYNMWHGHGRYNESCVAWMPVPEPYRRNHND